MIDNDLLTGLQKIENLLREWSGENVELFLVGGFVRDALLGEPSNDIDMIARGLPQSELHRHLGRLGNVEVTGAVFGVTRFFPHDKSLPMLEISLPRREISLGFGHKDFKVEFDHTLPIEDDLIRRDFTVNSFALAVRDGSIVQRGGAMQDLNDGVLRALSDTSAEEDPLRILRALRFISKLGFEVEPSTDKQLRQAVGLLEHVSSERLQQELLKILVGKHVGKALRYAQEIGVWKVIMPELEACVGVSQNHYHSLTVFEHIVEVVQNTPSDDPFVRLAALFHDIAKPPTKWIGPDGVAHFYGPDPKVIRDLEREAKTNDTIVLAEVWGHHEEVGADMARTIMNRLRFSNENVSRVSALVLNHMFIQGENLRRQAARKLLNRFAHVPGGLENNIDALFAIRTGDVLGGKVDKINTEYLDMNAKFHEVVKAEVEKETAFKVTDLAIGGHELMEVGIPQGPVYGKILNALLDEVIENPDLNNRDDLLNIVYDAMQGGGIYAL